MATTDEEWHAIDRLISQSSRHDTFWPKVNSKALAESEDPQARYLAQVCDATRSLAAEFLEEKRVLANDAKYGEEGKREVLQELLACYQERVQDLKENGIQHLKRATGR